MESFINALPYQKGGAANAEADRCDKSGATGLNKIVPTISSPGLIFLVISFCSLFVSNKWGFNHKSDLEFIYWGCWKMIVALTN